MKLSRSEIETIARRVDLWVPYCGDYAETNTWTAEERRAYDRLLEKRRRSEELERRGIEETIAAERGRSEAGAMPFGDAPAQSVRQAGPVPRQPVRPGNPWNFSQKEMVPVS